MVLPVEYVREHVRLGYAATEHGYQADTVDTAIALATSATSRRGLYVAMTRGRDRNDVHVVTDTTDIAEAVDVLDGVLAVDRADTPAVTTRRDLAQHDPRHDRRRGVRSRTGSPPTSTTPATPSPTYGDSAKTPTATAPPPAPRSTQRPTGSPQSNVTRSRHAARSTRLDTDSTTSPIITNNSRPVSTTPDVVSDGS